MHLGMAECSVPFLGCCDCDLVIRKMVSEAYLLYYFIWNPKFGVWVHLGMEECRIPFLGHCDLDL